MLLLFGALFVLSNNITATFVPEAGGTYVEGVAGSPGNLNPLYFENQTDRDLGALIFRGLTRTTASGSIEPDLARTWAIGGDDTVYTFTLRNDVFWHDGEPFTAEDVAFTFGIIQDPAFGGRPELVDVWRDVEIEVIDPLTVRFTLAEPFAPFLSYTTLGIIPRHVLAETPVGDVAAAAFSRSPTGTGPWRVADVQSDHITLEPHADFYGPAPMLDYLTMRFYPSTTATYEAYERGEVLGISQVRAEDVATLSQLEQLNLYNAPRSGYAMVALNLRRPLFSDQNVREALLVGLDRNALISDVRDGQGVVAHSFYLPTHWAYNPDVKTYAYDVARARELLDQSGWQDRDQDGVREKDGTRLKFVLLTNEENPTHVELIDRIAQQWAQIGVQAEPRTVGFSDLVRTYLRPREFDAILLNAPTKPTTDPDVYPLWHSSQTVDEGLNWAGWNDARVDTLLEDGRRILDHNTRREIYAALQHVFAEEVPSLLLYHPVYNYAVDEEVRNVQIGPVSDPSDRFRTLPEWYVNVRRVIVTETPDDGPDVEVQTQ